MTKKIKNLVIFICLAVAMLALANFTLAAELDVGLDRAAGTGLSAANDPRVIAANIIRIALGFLGLIALGLIIYAGWLWMTADGQAEKIEQAKKILLGAVIGLVIILSSFAIASFILARLLEATGGGGGDGTICEPACASGQYCCNSLCSNSPCGGGLPPGGGPGAACDANPLEAGCQVNSTSCRADLFCNTISCTCQAPSLPGDGQPCLTDPLDVQCAAGQCAAGLSCSSSDCLCRRTDQPGEGQSCDGEANLTGCQATDCADNLVCSSNDNCTCVRTPLIAWISPLDAADTPNGAAGNFITIGGRYFGATPGQVIFMGDPNNTDDDEAAIFPNQVNPLCVNFWQDNQIVAVVPAGALSGPVKVADSQNYYDTTDNNRGARLNDFLINDIRRPGLCQVDPTSGGLADEFTLQGSAFNGSAQAVLFGSSASAVTADDINGWTDTSVMAAVPNIRDGRNSVFVQVNNINSNDLVFTVRNNADLNPVIEYLEPAQGPAGQYITIYGRNFKTYDAQKSWVKFYWPADPTNLILADTDFPEKCRLNWWHDKYIIVKVPEVAADRLGDYKVVVNNSDSRTSLPADFTINNEAPGPGLCLLEPDNGPVAWPVNVYGERFGSSQANRRVQFFNNKQSAVRSWSEQKIETNVPNGAANGPVKIVKEISGGMIADSNSLPFKVGECSLNSDCEQGQECCGSGTYWSGICRAAGTCAQGSPLACEFGWTFSTSGRAVGDFCYNGGQAGACDVTRSNCGPDLVCDPTDCICRQACDPATNTCDDEPPPIESCAGYGASQCSDSYFCPNSPGKCSANAGGEPVDTGVKCGDAECNKLGRCKDEAGNGLCSYNSTLNKCVKIAATCDLTQTINDINGQPVELKCGLVDGQTVWHYDSRQTCVSGYTKSIDKNKCLGAVCQACSAGFICRQDGDGGICVTDINICPAGAGCLSDQCIKTTTASCECCCNKTENTASGNPACCTGLSCQASCGAGGDFGLCTGCTVAGDQAASNAKCNCSGTSGKICDMAGAGGLGVCLDCAALISAEECSTKGVGVCCVDAKNNNACMSGTDTVRSSAAGDQNNYCAYYECQTAGASAACNGPVASSTWPTYRTEADCTVKCQSPPQFGLECAAFGEASGQRTVQDSCDISQCADFSCLNEDGSGPTAPNSCGTCCCDPRVQSQCAAINPRLSCYANKGECSGANRGLCCGCSQDNECGDANALGCGGDTCCQPRPSITETAPADGATQVCRNSLIKATFNQAMNTNTFKTNLTVVGDYGASPCPAGTKYLTEVYQPTIFARLKFWLIKMPLANKLFTAEAQALIGNFCSVAGQVSGLVKTDAAGSKTTELEFKSQQALEANRQYYVIIKGDSDITDSVSNGVLSQDGIGMRAEGYNSENPVRFNGLAFFNAKVWSFTTKEATADDNGICLIDEVVLSPSDYLFSTAVNDAADDDPAGSNYDIIRDSDKVFRATAYSLEKQAIAPLEDLYNWRWDWEIDDQAVVKFKNGGQALDDRPDQTIVAQNVKDDNTFVRAKATITQDQVNKKPTTGQSKEKAAPVYVFLCSNPWPPFAADGGWAPWQDRSDNCTVVAGNCWPTNFALYYCRDAGAAGTADDLPAIMSGSTVIRGQANDILKEFYFFREDLPEATGISLATTTNDAIRQGGKAGLVWQGVAEAQKYTIYYGTAATNLTQSIIVTTNGTAAEPAVISNLTNGVKYYFAVTATYDTGAESAYSNKTTARPADVAPPVTPVLSGTANATSTANLSWPANQADTAFYKIYYGATSGALGASVSLDKSKCTNGQCKLKINNLNSGTTYYFAISAVDGYKNESNKSDEVDLIIK